MSISKLKEIIKSSNNIVFFGGAGVSTESGIPDFRSSTGLFNEKLNSIFAPEEIVSHSFLRKYPSDFFKFYKSKLIYPEAKPNDAHKALAKLEEVGKLKAVITQNIDGLHQMAGSKNVYELHGSIHKNYCTKCHKSYSLDFILNSKDIPLCEDCGGMVRPNVVLYGEPLNNTVMGESLDAIEKADTLIVGGTSLKVYPASGLLYYFKGKHLILINKSETSYDKDAEITINASIGETLKQAAKEY